MPKMTSVSTRHFGKIFDDIATEYDRHRPDYPDKLIDYACTIAGLESGDRVLELGCGSGQLTRALIARGFRVTAVEPGRQLIALAEKNAGGPGVAEFVNAKFEDVALPEKQYKAVFCASAFHWIDPDTSWRKTAELLAPGGVLALVQYFGLSEQRTASDLDLLLAVLRRVAPEIAASWPHYYELDEIIAGAKARHENISDVWAWLGNYDLARGYVHTLYDNTQIAAMPHVVEQTADELIALFRTTSPYRRLSEQQRTELEDGYKEVYEKLGRPIRSSTVRILVTARRRP